MIRLLYARVKIESVCAEGRVGNNGAHARSVGVSLSASVKDARAVLDAGVDMRCEMVVSAWRRNVVTRVSNMGPGEDSGSGIESKYRWSADFDGGISTCNSVQRRGCISCNAMRAASNCSQYISC